VAEAESVLVTDGAYVAMLETSGGDLRKAITTLQSCSRLKASNDEKVRKTG